LATTQSIQQWAMGWTTSARFSAGETYFLYSIMSRLDLGPTQLLIQCVLRALSPEAKQLEGGGGEADHSPSSNAKVYNAGAVPPLPHVFMVWCLINYAQG
jgi:hypothetical protein